MRYWEECLGNYYLAITEHIALRTIDKNRIPNSDLIFERSRYRQILEIPESDVPEDVVKMFDKKLQDPFFEIDLERFRHSTTK
jgi:hypothetical protein